MYHVVPGLGGGGETKKTNENEKYKQIARREGWNWNGEITLTRGRKSLSN
jgi:hypothetical protein